MVDLYGRKIGQGLSGETKRDLWLGDDRPGLLPFDAVAGDELIVTATILDALRLWTCGRRNVTALHGLDGPVDALGRAVARHEPRRVLAVLPPTDEGDRAAERILAELSKTIATEVRHVRVPSKPSPERFAAAVDAAIAALPAQPSISSAAPTTERFDPRPLASTRIRDVFGVSLQLWRSTRFMPRTLLPILAGGSSVRGVPRTTRPRALRRSSPR